MAAHGEGLGTWLVPIQTQRRAENQGQLIYSLPLPTHTCCVPVADPEAEASPAFVTSHGDRGRHRKDTTPHWLSPRVSHPVPHKDTDGHLSGPAPRTEV